MSHTLITIFFWTTFILGTFLGFYLFTWWAKRIWGKLNTSLNKEAAINLNSITLKSFIYSFPGLILLILCLIPSLFFNNLLKKEDYCISIVNINKGIEKDDEFIVERCRFLDIDELFIRAKENKSNETPYN